MYKERAEGVAVELQKSRQTWQKYGKKSPRSSWTQPISRVDSGRTWNHH